MLKLKSLLLVLYIYIYKVEVGMGAGGGGTLPLFTNSKTFLETPGGARVILKRRRVLLVPGFWRRWVGGAMGGVVVRDIRGRREEEGEGEGEEGLVGVWLVFGWRKVLCWVVDTVIATVGDGGRRLGGRRWGRRRRRSGKFRSGGGGGGGGSRRMRGRLVFWGVCACGRGGGEEGVLI